MTRGDALDHPEFFYGYFILPAIVALLPYRLRHLPWASCPVTYLGLVDLTGGNPPTPRIRGLAAIATDSQPG
ncbi:MAG: hypothetical protein WCA35_23485 [Kovacikia sp.]